MNIGEYGNMVKFQDICYIQQINVTPIPSIVLTQYRCYSSNLTYCCGIVATGGKSISMSTCKTP